MGKLRIGRLWSVVLTLLVVYALIKWGVPAASREITALPFPMPVPGTLTFIFMVLTVVALFLYVTFSDENLEEFLRPIRRFLCGDNGKIPRAAVLTVIPVLVAWQVYDMTAPKVELPPSLRIQHPSSNFPKKFEALKNPFANPAVAEVEAFIEQLEADEIEFIPQVQGDVNAWWEEHADEPMIGFIPTAPINFTDNGTIETIVEGYTFWRVTNGGPGLPTEATPWDSAMPEWKLSLTEEERWKIILAEYDLAEKTPRIPEGH